MTCQLDHHATNHMTAAIDREMSPAGRRRPDADTIFMGITPPSDADQNALARFGLDKNYKMILPSFDAADPARGPVDFHAVVTDGLTESIILAGGRLWKRDRRSPSVLLFPDAGIVVRVNSKGRLVVRGMTGRFHDHGYELAREAVLARAARKPGRAPVVSWIGTQVAVLDIVALRDTFANAD